MRRSEHTVSPLRQFLLLEALAFVRSASRLPGVLRIVLIGSLTTEKADPKDVDLLVTVADDLDLKSLASAGRKLKGGEPKAGTAAPMFSSSTPKASTSEEHASGANALLGSVLPVAPIIAAVDRICTTIYASSNCARNLYQFPRLNFGRGS